MIEYLLKARDITILDMTIVAIVASIIAPTTMSIATWIIKKVGAFFHLQYRKMKGLYVKRKRFENGQLNMKEIMTLKKKKPEELTDLEKHALVIAEDNMKARWQESKEKQKALYPNLFGKKKVDEPQNQNNKTT